MLNWLKILCAVDFSETSRDALEHAADLARRFEAELTLIHVRDVQRVAGSEIVPTEKLLEEEAHELGHKLEEWKTAAELIAGRPVRTLLESGAAAKKMRQLMKAQGPPPETAMLGGLRHDVVAPRDGVVEAVDCLRLARIARLAGAPIDKGAGVDFFKKIGDPVEKGEPLYRIHAAFEADFRFSSKFASEGDGVTVMGPR